MRLRRLGRIAINMLAAVLLVTALLSLAGVPARFLDRTSQGVPRSHGPRVIVRPGGSPSPSPVRACEEPTLIGKVVIPSVAARKWPSRDAPVIARFRQKNAQRARQVFDIRDTVMDSARRVWFQAVLPVRPNGTTGYIAAGSLRLFETSYRIVVNREKLRLTLWKGCRAVKRFRIGLGKESTPTPNGTFYINSLLKPPSANTVYGKWAYGLSAFSNAITNWEGGGVIGLHGTNDPSSIGNRKSHGCIRLYNWDISKLVRILPLGTPVEIR